MPYTVNKSNSSASPSSYTVQDGVVNTQTDLSLLGKGYAGYGESIAENFLHLLENFSNTTAPTKPVSGQLWWDSTNSKLKVYTGTAWQTAGGSAGTGSGIGLYLVKKIISLHNGFVEIKSSNLVTKAFIKIPL